MADKYDDLDFYRWVRTDSDGKVKVSRPYNSISTIKGMMTQFRTYAEYLSDPQTTTSAQKLVAVLANEPIKPTSDPDTWGSSLTTVLRWVDIDV